MNRMPAEWEPHAGTWMSWPPSNYIEGDPEESDRARAAWAAVALAVSRFEPLTMMVDPADEQYARDALGDAVRILVTPLDDSWMRDNGPTFVRTDAGLAGIDWVFNGWGAQQWAEWEKDAEVARYICADIGVPAIASPMVNEGGGIHVNGAGTVLVTRTVQLGEGRNPDWTQEQVEAELSRTLGVDRVIWIDRGLTRDYEQFGTRGHIDIVACFINEDTVLVHDQRNPKHPDYEVSRDVMKVMADAGLTVIPVPAPEVIRDEHDWVDYSYINHYVCNGGVILCAFDDPGDAHAREILAQAYPDREIVLVDARSIFARGGGIHCITQQQPIA